jgi:hypothetical protein
MNAFDFFDKFTKSVVAVESDCVVVSVEVSWELSHEGIANNQVVETIWNIHGHEAHQALGHTKFGDLNNVVVRGQNVVSLINSDSEVRESVDTCAC